MLGNVCPVEQTLLVLKPDGVPHLTTVMKQVERDHGFRVVAERAVRMTLDDVDMWYEELRERDFYPSLQRYLTRGPCHAVLLERVDAIRGLRRFVGPTDPQQARLDAPLSIRAQIGSSVQENAVHASDSPEAVRREKAILFPAPLST
ncbi:nucleoside diphosphate kinase [Fennellomyces sp. T-0311]|nr:nucleoside diphosphate kinase [Fennellomyces sp. T-0311]